MVRLLLLPPPRHFLLPALSGSISPVEGGAGGGVRDVDGQREAGHGGPSSGVSS